MEIEDTPATAGMLEKELAAFRKILIEVNCNVDAACTNGSQHAEQNIQCHRKIKETLGKTIRRQGDEFEKIEVIGQLLSGICWRRGEHYGESVSVRFQR